MSALDQFRAAAGSRRAEVANRLDTSERAMRTSLDKVLVRAASSGTTSVSIGGVPGQSGPSWTPHSTTGGGRSPWIAGACAVIGAGVLAVAITTNPSDATNSSAAVETRPTTQASAPPEVTAAAPETVDTQPPGADSSSEVDSDAMSESANTNPAPSTSTVVTGSPQTPVLIPPPTSEAAPPAPSSDTIEVVDIDDAENRNDDTAGTTGGSSESNTPDDSETPDDTGDGDPANDDPGDETTSDNASIDNPPPAPPSSSGCGSTAGLPAGAVATIADAGDFDGDGAPDQAGLYNTPSGAQVVIDRSTAGLTDPGELGDKPVGDLGSEATVRDVRLEGATADIGLVLDALDDDGVSMWVRPFGVTGCSPTPLVLPASLEDPEGDDWNGASFTAEGRDFGLQCRLEGDLTILTYLDNDEVGATLAFDPEEPSLEPDGSAEATDPGCWT